MGGDRVEPQEPEKEAEAAAAVVESARTVVVKYMPGHDPELLGLEVMMDWEAQALFLRCADMVKGED
jgi:hypothetical protein